MTRAVRTFAFAMIAAPLALGLAACSKEGDATKPSGEPIARIAPPAGKAWADVVSKTAEGGYVMGNPDAPIKLIEFGSLTCPHCADFAEKSAAELRDTFVASGRVSFEFRNFTRDAIDITAAQLARCGAPESFFALTEQLFSNQQAMFTKVQSVGEPAYEAAMKLPDNQRGVALGQLTGLTEFVGARGIARDQANACLADSATAQALAKGTQDQTEKYQITGTPTFLVNGSKVDMNTWPELKAHLESLGAR